MNPAAGRIIEAALRLGATAAGVVRTDLLAGSPSFVAASASTRFANGSIVVLALAHPAEDSDLDAWDGEGGTPGNRALAGIAARLASFVRDAGRGGAEVLPYHFSRGGVFLKDAAALAGLGAIGRNNLLVTPTWGPRIRLRGLWIEEAIEGPGPSSFDPCRGCDGPCASGCPEDAFAGGKYAREKCMIRMQKDEAAAVPGPAGGATVRYCRACETSCPAGSART